MGADDDTVTTNTATQQTGIQAEMVFSALILKSIPSDGLTVIISTIAPIH